MKSESPTLAILAARCQKISQDNPYAAAASSEGFKLYTEWQDLIARTSHPLSIQERQEIDSGADSLFNRMRNFVVYNTSQLSF